MKKLTTLVAVTACLPLTTIAQTERDLDSHEHGAALLNVAIVGSDVLVLELESPWDNIVGFEHAPETDEQHELLDAAAELLENTTELFALEAGNCSLTSSDIDSGLELAHDDHDDHDDDHGDEKHDDDHGDDHAKDEDEHHDDDHGDEHAKSEDEHHDDDHGDDHDDEHADHDDHGDEESHSELLATYEFTCPSLADLKTIDVKFLKQWTGFETLTAQLIGPGGQGRQELSTSNTTLDLGDIQ